MNNTVPPLTTAIAARVEACEVAFWAEKVAALGALAGNPYGAQVRRFGGATAMLAQQTGNNGLFNRVGTLSRADLSQLDDIIAWYHDQGIKTRFDIIPTLGTPEVLGALANGGLYQSSFYTALYGVPQTAPSSPADISVRAVTAEESERFAAVYCDGFGIPQTATLRYLPDGVRVLLGKPSLHCLFALSDDTPVAMAILYLYQNTGYLATAATLPAWRGRGCQTALLRARIAIAAEAGCDLIVGHTGIMTTSQHNMEQVGLRIAYTKAIWTERAEQ